MVMSTEKKCSCCGESKVLSKDYFYPSKYRVDGFADRCKVCEIKESKVVSIPWVDQHLVGLAKKKKQQEARDRRKKVEDTLKLGHKVCTKCSQTKSLFDFHIDKKMATGYSSWCKDCKRSSKGDKAKEQQHDTSIGQQEGSSPEVSNR